MGKNPFHSKYRQETLSLNREYVISFDDPKFKTLSFPGKFSFPFRKLNLLAQDLLMKMLEKEPVKRPTFNECLEHEFFQNNNRRNSTLMFTFTKNTLIHQ